MRERRRALARDQEGLSCAGSPAGENRYGFGNEDIEQYELVPLALEAIDQSMCACVVDICFVEQTDDDVGINDDLSHRRVVRCLARHRRSRLA